MPCMIHGRPDCLDCDPDFSDEYDDGTEDYEPEFDCHMDRNGGCGKAGSEECEFECPYNKH